jgi:glyoxylase I family protein
MRIKLTSIMVDDQAKALAFYTDVLGFTKKLDFPVGEYRWITVTAEDRDDLELALEPNANPAGKAFQAAMFSQRIPVAAFEVDDLDAEFARLSAPRRGLHAEADGDGGGVDRDFRRRVRQPDPALPAYRRLTSSTC